MVAPGSTDLSKLAMRFRVASGVKEGNIAIVEIEQQGQTWYMGMSAARGRLATHGEWNLGKDLLRQKINPSDVRRIYSELEPCLGPPGTGCASFLTRTFPETDITYSFEYANRASRSAGLARFQEYVESLSATTK
jgi:Xanthomonas XOO_2897-like deaminase